MAEAIFYLLFASCIAWVSWVVIGTLGGVRRRRKSRLREQALAEYLLERANQKKNYDWINGEKVTYEQALVAHGWVLVGFYWTLWTLVLNGIIWFALVMVGICAFGLSGICSEGEIIGKRLSSY